MIVDGGREERNEEMEGHVDKGSSMMVHRANKGRFLPHVNGIKGDVIDDSKPSSDERKTRD